MRIGILGTGTVGATLGGKLVAGGHEVRMGSRTAGNPRAVAWVAGAGAGAGASEGTFADAASFGEVVLKGIRNPTALSAAFGTLGRVGLLGQAW